MYLTQTQTLDSDSLTDWTHKSGQLVKQQCLTEHFF